MFAVDALLPLNMLSRNKVLINEGVVTSIGTLEKFKGLVLLRSRIWARQNKPSLENLGVILEYFYSTKDAFSSTFSVYGETPSLPKKNQKYNC